MDEQAVRQGAGEFIEALKDGDIGKASQQMSPELRQNLGEVVAMLPLPLSEGTIETVETTGSGYRAVLGLTNEGGSMRLETRWKDRDGTPTIVEASHLADEVAPIQSEQATESLGEEPG
jgi:hypothetical protein